MLSPSSWPFKKFPDLDPATILELRDRAGKPVSEREKARAYWLWKRRPSDFDAIRLLFILGFGAMLHLPLIVLGDFRVFVVYHLLYVALVVLLAGQFVWKEARYRRWQKDYLKALARLAEADEQPQRNSHKDMDI